MLPGITTRYVDRQLSTRLAIQDFFRQNEDLIPYRQYLGFVYNEMAAKHADWDMSQVLKESEKEVRSRLSIARQNPGASPEPGRAGATRTAESQPAFVPKGGSRKGQAQTDVRTGEEKQIEDLIS